jgi:chromosome segregation ATPase
MQNRCIGALVVALITVGSGQVLASGASAMPLLEQVAELSARVEGLDKQGKEAADSLEKAKSTIDELSKRLEAVEKQLSAARDNESKSLERRGSYPGAAARGQAQTTVGKGSLDASYAKCPAGYFMVSLQLLKVGTDTAEFWYDCRRVFD